VPLQDIALIEFLYFDAAEVRIDLLRRKLAVTLCRLRIESGRINQPLVNPDAYGRFVVADILSDVPRM
jgi:hypothetical protein